jgi:hypothetical protein
MSTLTKLALGMMGHLRPAPAKGDAAATIAMPAPTKTRGMPLMEALAKRCSAREFDRRALWDARHWPDLAGLPSFARVMVDAGKLGETPEEMQALIDKDVRERLY